MADPKSPVIIKLHPDRKEYIRAENEFLRAIGLCVNTWSFVDRELYRIFRFGLSRFGLASASKAASILYYKQTTLDRHIQLANDMLEHVLATGEFKNEWRPLQKKLRGAALTRNIIVHHPALRTHTSKGGKAAYLYSIHIEPYEQLLNKKYCGLKGKSALAINDLKQHAVEVEGLTIELHAFLKTITRAHQRGY
jgi:hypothetical protein